MSTSYTQTELQAKKVPDLKAILTQLGASTSGVKVDLVARILENQSSSSKTDLPAAGNALGAIPSESELPSSTTNDDSTSAAASESAPTSVPTSGSAAVDSTNGAKEGETAAANLPASTDKVSEADKRANRLKRFGNEEELAKLERAERFGATGADGIDDKSVSKLDSELSNKRMRKNADGPSSTTPKAGAKPKLERTKSGNGKPQSKGQAKPQSSSNGAAKPQSKAATPAAKVLDPEEEEKRKKRAERFNAPKASAGSEATSA